MNGNELMTRGWMRTTIDFGYHCSTLRLTGRNKLHWELGKALHELGDGPKIEIVAETVKKFIEKVRPDLEGLILYKMGMSAGGMSLEFTVFHSSLPEISLHEEPKRQELERCAACLKSMWTDDPQFQLWIRVIPLPNGSYREELVCSKECSEIRQEDALPKSNPMYGG